NTQTDPLTMRTNPSSSNYTTIMMIPKGAEISVKGETGSFYFVDYKGKLGWVSGAYVKFADDASSTPTSSEATSSETSSQG
ncbi:MAG: SH3 domain-containing protein, partial [Clostridia bacterium]|nr:SH3 domain-containing protein [Clostridia bacterium]